MYGLNSVRQRVLEYRNEDSHDLVYSFSRKSYHAKLKKLSDRSL